MGMKIWNGIDSLPDDLAEAVVSIGKCDGVHLGHQEILRRLVAEARRLARPAWLISFDPHPLAVVAPERLPRMLQTRRQKLDCLEETGLTDFLLLRFTSELAALEGERFFVDYLRPRLPFGAIFVGENFRFGNRRDGDVELLRAIGARDGFRVEAVPPVRLDGKPISSSAIRQALNQGEVESAHRMLGRPFEVVGEIVEGDGRGRAMRFPTANVRIENQMVPRPGVYITETVALAARHASVTNVGVRPTFGGRRLTVESHLLDFDGDLYAERVAVRFLAHLRGEMRFANASQLADQIARDRAAATAYFQHVYLGLS